MSAKKLDDALIREALAAKSKYGTVTKAAKALGIPRATLQHRIEAADRADTEVPNSAGRIAELERALKEERARTLGEDSIRQEIIGLARAAENASAPEWVIEETEAGAHGVPSLFVSDLHWGEVVDPSQIGGVNVFNVATAKERLRLLSDGAVLLLRILDPKMDYPGIVVNFGGDMISGNIHDELRATNEFNSMPTLLDLYGELIAFLGSMADTFGRVFVPCVTGNHGRDTVKIWAKDRHATSFDWLLYCLLAKHFEADKRITFLIPNGPDAYYRIFGHRYLLTHGDQFRGGDGMIGALGPIIRGDHKKRGRNAQINREYDTLLLGHWHQLIHLTRLIVNGSLKGYDEYAYSSNFPFEPAQQALWVTHPKHGITYRMPIKLQDVSEEGARQLEWVSVPK